MTIEDFWKWLNEEENYEHLINLYFKWKIGKKDIESCIKSLNKHYKPQNIEFIEGTQDFHFKVRGDDGGCGTIFAGIIEGTCILTYERQS